jgi:hypothetical protein
LPDSLLINYVCIVERALFRIFFSRLSVTASNDNPKHNMATLSRKEKETEEHFLKLKAGKGTLALPLFITNARGVVGSSTGRSFDKCGGRNR